MLTITLMIMTLSMGFLIGRNLKIIDYEIREENLRRDLANSHSQLMRLRQMVAPAPPLKKSP